MKQTTIFPVIMEFLRYVLVGGAAFGIDICVLYLARTFLFSGIGTKGILCAAALGFTAGLVFNYFLSLIFVFKNIDEKAKRRKFFSFAVFTVIGIAGLGITEFCMYAGVRFFGQERYLPVKIATAAIVLVWNYTARKFFVFKGAQVAAN